MTASEQSLLDAGHLMFGAQEGSFSAWRICRLYCQVFCGPHGQVCVTPSTPAVPSSCVDKNRILVKGTDVILVYGLIIYSGNLELTLFPLSIQLGTYPTFL